MEHDAEIEKTQGSCAESSRITVEELGAMIALFKESGVTDFEMKTGDTELKIAFNRPAAAPVYAAPAPIAAPAPEQIAPLTAPAAIAAPAAAPAPEEKPGTIFKSPMVGTFYRSPSPDSSPYVELGTRVNDETVVCIIEAMKIMNEIKAEMRGTIAEILVENGHPVEYGQPIFRIVAG